MKKASKIHNQIKNRKIKRFSKEVFIYILRYLCPAFVLIGGLYGTFILVTSLGYNKISRMWDIEYSFALAIIGLTGTIIFTNLAVSCFKKLTN
jgi:hypothetical protein